MNKSGPEGSGVWKNKLQLFQSANGLLRSAAPIRLSLVDKEQNSLRVRALPSLPPSQPHRAHRSVSTIMTNYGRGCPEMTARETSVRLLAGRSKETSWRQKRFSARGICHYFLTQLPRRRWPRKIPCSCRSISRRPDPSGSRPRPRCFPTPYWSVPRPPARRGPLPPVPSPRTLPQNNHCLILVKILLGSFYFYKSHSSLKIVTVNIRYRASRRRRHFRFEKLSSEREFGLHTGNTLVLVWRCNFPTGNDVSGSQIGFFDRKWRHTGYKKFALCDQKRGYSENTSLPVCRSRPSTGRQTEICHFQYRIRHSSTGYWIIPEIHHIPYEDLISLSEVTSYGKYMSLPSRICSKNRFLIPDREDVRYQSVSIHGAKHVSAIINVSIINRSEKVKKIGKKKTVIAGKHRA